MRRKHAELPGEPANSSVLLTAKVRDRDKGTEKGREQGETALEAREQSGNRDRCDGEGWQSPPTIDRA